MEILEKLQNYIAKNMDRKSAATRMRRVSMGLGLFIILQLGMVVLRSHNELNDGSKIAINAMAIGRNLGSYKNDKLINGNYFISGMEGKLYWKPSTLTESILLNTFSQNGSAIDIIEVISFAIMSVFFIFIIKDASDSALFHKGVYNKFIILILVISMWGGVVDMIKSILAHQYITYITDGQFTATYVNTSIFRSYSLGLLLSLLIVFPQRAIELQEEQDLTI